MPIFSLRNGTTRTDGLMGWRTGLKLFFLQIKFPLSAHRLNNFIKKYSATAHRRDLRLLYAKF